MAIRSAAIPLAAALLLAACASPTERLAATDARDDQQCQHYGAQPGSNAYVKCRTELETARRTALATRQAGGIIAPSLYDQ